MKQLFLTWKEKWLARINSPARIQKNINAKLKRENVFNNFSPWKAIFYITLPTVIISITYTTYQIIDKWIATQWGGGYIISHYSNSTHVITAVDALKIINIATTYAAVPYSILVACSLVISVGTGVKFSIYYGKNKKEDMSYYVGNGVISSIIFSLIATVGMFFLAPVLIKFQSGADNSSSLLWVKEIIVKEAIKFSRIMIYGTVLIFGANFWVTMLRSEGRIKAIILVNVIGFFVNIGMDFLLVIVAKLGMEGTAYGTLTALVSSVCVCLFIVIFGGSHIRFRWEHLRIKRWIISGILIMGAASLLQNVAQSLLAMVSVRLLDMLPAPGYEPGASGVPVYVQLYGGIMPWLLFINAPIIGISQGARTLVGYVYGSKNYVRLWKIINRLVIFQFLLLLSSLLLLAGAGQYMMHMFGVDLAMASHFKILIILQFAFYPLAFSHFTSLIFFQSINKGKIALLTTLLRTMIMPAICLALGYTVALTTRDGTYYYLFVGFVDLFTSVILLPVLAYSFFRSRKYIFPHVSHEEWTKTKWFKRLFIYHEKVIPLIQ